MNAEHNAMTDEQIAEAMAADVCAVCGKTKSRAMPFCSTDYAVLPLPSRLALADPDRRLDAFRSAFRHLLLNSDRKHELNAWPFSTDEELYEAGYLWREHKRCQVPGCGMRISIWLTPRPNRHSIALDRITRQPHRLKCTDPEYFRRLREKREAEKLQQREARKAARLKTSAQRRRDA